MKPGNDAFGDFTGDSLKVVIGYEDFSSGLRALKICKSALEAAVEKSEVKIWKFEPLGIPEVFAEAERDLILADVVILSISGDRPLPLEAVEWVERCGKRTNPDGAMLFIVDSEHQNNPSMALACAFLGRIARKSKLRFFPPPGWESDGLRITNGWSSHNSAVTDAVTHSSRYDPWGLNE